MYIDGANMNALVGLAKPGQVGADVSHLNLHKTFCIPHGGGGPGVGPVAVQVAPRAVPAGHPLGDERAANAVGMVQRAPLRQRRDPADLVDVHHDDGRAGPAQGAPQVAILNANYIAKRLAPHFPVLYTGRNGLSRTSASSTCGR